MAKIPLNPLNWFKSKDIPRIVPSVQSEPSTKRIVQPRRSGGIFMHLITLQKSVQSLELAVEQGIDATRLLQKACDSVLDLRREAESAGNEDLIEGSAQILAYLDTVGEGRLELNDEGVGIILDFVSIFKDALGDAVPGIKMLNEKRLAEWNEGYQVLMARMKPMSEEEPATEELEDEAAVVPFVLSNGDAEDPSEEPFAVVQDTKEIGQEAGSIADADAEAVNPGEAAEPDEEAVLPAEHEPEDLFEPAEPVEVVDIHDVKIPDAETVSAREAIESGHLQASDDGGDFIESNGKALTPLEFRPKRNGDNRPTTPVQLEEVERLKKKLLELHEKQEMLSSKMSGILVDLKNNAESENREREPVSVEKMDVDELEDLIFIGRKKG